MPGPYTPCLKPLSYLRTPPVFCTTLLAPSPGPAVLVHPAPPPSSTGLPPLYRSPPPAPPRPSHPCFQPPPGPLVPCHPLPLLYALPFLQQPPPPKTLISPLLQSPILRLKSFPSFLTLILPAVSKSRCYFNPSTLPTISPPTLSPYDPAPTSRLGTTPA